MKKKTQISKEDLESLLNWLSADSVEAGLLYEEFRKGLVRFFRYRGCSECDELADEALNRVALRLKSLDLTKGVKKVSIIYGFAYNIFREYLRDKQALEEQFDDNFQLASESKSYDENVEKELNCLEKCLNELPQNKKELITLYFSKEKAEKIKLREKIAKELKITPNALHVRVYRIKSILKKCIEKCNKKK